MSLTGLFQNLNNILAQAPAAGAGGQGMLDMASQGAGQVFGGLTNTDPMKAMSQGAKQNYGQEQMADLDMSKPEDVMKASQFYQQMGKPEQAMMLADRAEKQQKAINAKNNASLEAMSVGIKEEAARKKAHSQKVQAMALARQRGDKEALTGLQAGTIPPEAYYKMVMDEKDDKPTVLADGATMHAADGSLLAENKKDHRPLAESVTGGYKMTAPDKNAYYDATEAWQKNSAAADSMAALKEQVAADPEWKSGIFATIDDRLTSITGSRDKTNYLRTEANRIRNSSAIGSLPTGPASDKDIELVMGGFPSNTAGKEEVVKFLKAQERVSRLLADYEQMKAEYIVQGKQGHFISDWKAKMDVITRQEYIDVTPVKAIELVQAHWDDQRVKDKFLLKYGWLPEEGEL